MSGNQLLIDEVILKLKGGADDLDAHLFLKEKGLTVEDCQEILATAHAQLLEQRLPRLSKKNKTVFFFLIFITVIVIAAVLFILPNPSFTGHKFILCVLGSVALTLCFYFLIVYYKTWTTTFLRKHGDVRIPFSFLPVFIIPAIVFYFILSWRFTSVANQSLAKDMIKANGTIISGYSLTTRKTDLATEVTVEFMTEEGEKITATEDISSYTFKQFYEGQPIELVYSRANPKNIDLLTGETDIKELTKSEDRDILPADLLEWMKIAPGDMEAHLDKVTYGWKPNSADSSWWINTRKKLDLKTGVNKIVLTAKADYWITFPKRLKEVNFKASESNSSVPFSRKPLLFETDLYVASVQLTGVANGEVCVITMTKK